MTFRSWWLAVLAVAAFSAAPVAASDEDEADDASDEAVEIDESSASADAVFEFLVAELAAQRGDVEGALSTYNRMARELRDPQVARRAVELAIRARAYAPALESAMLLLELEPSSSLAREIIAALLANEGDLTKARDTLTGVFDRNRNRGGMLLQLPHLFAKFPDKIAVMEATRHIASRYPEMPEAHHAIGVAALLATQLDLAGAEADKALELRPDWDQAAILKAQVLRKVAPEGVIGFYRGFVDNHPSSLEVRMQLGRELAAERKLAEAREQFRAAEKLSSKDSQAAYAIGLLSLQLEEHAEAQSAFTRALKLGYREPAAIYLGLGQAAEGLKRVEEAIGWYQKVESGDWVRAQLKVATLIARQQGLDAGREYLRRIEPRSGDDRVQVIQVEAQLLRDAKAWGETYDMLSKAVAQNPDSYELLYDRAMAAERVDRIDVLEQDLRRVIKMKPDYAHAYNALGYTLAERTERLSEAKDLIEKAHKLAPEDPFILDSLGWVQFRLGEFGDALKNLHAAYSSRNDPEIAAHLGEVLWKVGQRDEAQKIWRAALTENPNHETLITVMQKYRP
ncbi:MAG TPA: tetratricopeptide repeat protein [Usitatibacter sp.]|nr:tetratricopeptide repeat protein [Usitatibacter sp.]